MTPTPSPVPTPRPQTQDILKRAREIVQAGTSYQNMDCSRFVQTLYSPYNTGFPRASHQQWEYVQVHGDRWTVYRTAEYGLDGVLPGDILFYSDPGSTSGRPDKIHHVAIVSENPGMMYDSTDRPGIDGVTERPIDSVVTRGEEEALRELFIIGYARQND